MKTKIAAEKKNKKRGNIFRQTLWSCDVLWQAAAETLSCWNSQDIRSKSVENLPDRFQFKGKSHVL